MTSCSLWGAETISQFGSQVTFLALPLVAILVLEESAFNVAALTSVAVPAVPALHPACRRLGRPAAPASRSSSLGDLGRALALASVPLAHWFGDADDLAALRSSAFVHGVCTVFFDVAYQSYLPALVGRDQVVEANAKLEISRAAANIGGPGIAGGLVAAADRACCRPRRRGQLPRLGAAARRHPQAGGGACRAPSAARCGHELVEGLRYVFGHSYQRTMVAMTALSNFFGQVVFSILLVYAVRELGLTAAHDRHRPRSREPGHARLGADRAPDRRGLGVGRTILLASLSLRAGDAADRPRASGHTRSRSSSPA